MVNWEGEEVQCVRIAVKIWRTCLADSEKNLDRRVAAFIWTREVVEYLRLSRIESF
jgi:hypothetical protein